MKDPPVWLWRQATRKSLPPAVVSPAGSTCPENAKLLTPPIVERLRNAAEHALSGNDGKWAAQKRLRLRNEALKANFTPEQVELLLPGGQGDRALVNAQRKKRRLDQKDAAKAA